VVDVVLPIVGAKLSVAGQVKPFLDNAARSQTGALETRLRNDPFLENVARSEWTKLCRAIPLGTAGQGMPSLWLEVRPTRAIAAQPKIDQRAVTLLLGVHADTRIVPSETKPNCPFPQQLDLVQQANEGSVNIAMPIDIPFPEVSKLLETQVAGKTYPEDGSGSFAATIKHADIAASGDRLLISLLVNVKKRGLFSFFGVDATVHVWGKPMLDQAQQVLRFTDVSLDVQSQAAFGLLGAAASRRALSAEGARRKGSDRLKTARRRCQEAHRHRRHELRRPGQRPFRQPRHQRSAADRHRLRRQDLAHHRQCRRHGRRRGVVAGDPVGSRNSVTTSSSPLRRLLGGELRFAFGGFLRRKDRVGSGVA